MQKPQPQPAYDSPLVRRLMGRRGKKPQALYMTRGEKPYGKGSGH